MPRCYAMWRKTACHRCASNSASSTRRRCTKSRPQLNAGIRRNAAHRLLLRFRQHQILEIRLYHTFESQRDRSAAAIERAADGHAHPAFADAIFLDRGFFLPVEANADSAREQCFVIKLAARIGAEAVGRR